MSLLNLKEKFGKDKEIYLRIKVRPMVAKTEAKEILGDGTIKVDVGATPTKGRANKELLKFLAREFGVIQKKISILSGHGAKIKLIKILK